METEGQQEPIKRPSASSQEVLQRVATKLGTLHVDEAVAVLAWEASEAELAALRARVAELETALLSSEMEIEELRSDQG